MTNIPPQPPPPGAGNSPPTPSEQHDIDELMRAIAAQQLANSEQIAKNAEGISELKTEMSELKANVAETTAAVKQLTNAVNAMMPVIQSHSQRFELQQATLQTMMAQLLKHDVQIKQIEAA